MKNDMHILALQVGANSVHASVLGAGPVARVEFALDHPTPEAAEVPPQRLWDAFTRAARQATRGIDTIDGIGLTCVSPALVLLGENDKPLKPIWMPSDRRARPAARQVYAAVGDEFLQSTGTGPLPGVISAISFRQVLTDDPHTYRHMRRYLHLNSWLALRLTGETAFDFANASLSGLFNTITDRQWSDRGCDFFNVEPRWLPPIVSGSTTLGPLRPEVAVELGVPPGIAVKLGADELTSALLAANLQPGELFIASGPTQVLVTLAPTPQPDPRRMTFALGVGEKFVHATHNPVSPAALDWLHQLCFRDQSRDEYLSGMLTKALQRPTRVTLAPPHLGGDPLELDARRAAFRDLTLATDRLDLLAAVVAEMRRQHDKALEALGQGTDYRRVVLCGEGAELIQRILCNDGAKHIDKFEQPALNGIALLFRGS